MVDLVLVRHGRTDWNAIQRIQGHADSDLDDLGHAQAAAVAPVLAALRPAALWSSDSVRARDTAAYLSSATGLSVNLDPRLREYSLGPREGLTHTEYEADDPTEYAEFRRANYDVVAGAENSSSVALRMTAALSDLAASLPADGLGLAVSHGSAIRTTVVALLGVPLEHQHAFRGVDNCSWTLLRRAVPDEQWRLVAYNRVVPLTPQAD